MRTPLVMRPDGSVSAMKATDLREVAERDRRIRQLEELNNSLAEQIDRMQLVIKMAQVWAGNDKGLTRVALRSAVETYNRTMKRLAKEVE